METTREDFEKRPWIDLDRGIRYKEFIEGNKKLKLAEYSTGFIENDWCLKAHLGYVLEGNFSINFSGQLKRFIEGDIIQISSGEESRHKLIIERNDYALIILVEDL
ncbi:MAG: hypothetical protein HRT72_07225 [Flavobacteriales bacterium]|nr:hypothetical protein [Flavobacteriales bacterium]